MIGPKLQKLKQTRNKAEMLSVFEDIKKEAETLNYPTPEFKQRMMIMLIESIEIFMRERNLDCYNQQNCKILDTFSILDNLK